MNKIKIWTLLVVTLFFLITIFPSLALADEVTNATCTDSTTKIVYNPQTYVFCCGKSNTFWAASCDPNSQPKCQLGQFINLIGKCLNSTSTGDKMTIPSCPTTENVFGIQIPVRLAPEIFAGTSGNFSFSGKFCCLRNPYVCIGQAPQCSDGNFVASQGYCYTASNTTPPPPTPNAPKMPDLTALAPSTWLTQLNLGDIVLPKGNMSFLENNLIPFMISLLFFILIIASLIFTIVGGIMWTISGGNKEGMMKAKNMVTYALVGLAIGLSAFIIVNILFSFFGVGQSSSSLPSANTLNGCMALSNEDDRKNCVNGVLRNQNNSGIPGACLGITDQTQIQNCVYNELRKKASGSSIF